MSQHLLIHHPLQPELGEWCAKCKATVTEIKTQGGECSGEEPVLKPELNEGDVPQ